MSLKKQDIFEGRSPEEWMREAAEIEAAIKDVHLQENEADKERLRSKILMEIYQQEKEKQHPKKTGKSRRILRAAAGFAIALVGIFGLSMTSQANRTFLVEKVQEVFSDDADVKVDNEDVRVESDTAEKEARDEIEKTLELDVPEFYYMPDGVEFSDFEIHPDVGIAEMRYRYGEKIITLHISSNDEKSVEGKNIDGTIKNVFAFEDKDISIEILELSNDVNDNLLYHAQWVYKNAYYWLTGVLDQTEIEKILKNMMF